MRGIIDLGRRAGNGPFFWAFNGPTITMPPGLAQSPGNARNFYNFVQKGRSFDVRDAADDVTEIDVYDEIGYWGITASEFKTKLNNAGDVRIRINSPGGDVFDGIAMYNDLIEHGKTHKVSIEIPGLAASAASLFAMAADEGELMIAPSAFVMIHNAWAIAIGDRHTHDDIAGTLRSIDGALNGVYQHRTGNTQPEISDWMDAETWFNGEEAVENGFADAVSSGDSEASALFDLSRFKNVPKVLLRQHEAATKRDAVDNTNDLEQRLMRGAELSRSQARALMRGGWDGMRGAAADSSGSSKRGAADYTKAFEEHINSLRD